MLIDVHQHIWTEPLVEALERRGSLPFIRRTEGLAMLHLAGEQPCILDLEAEADETRSELVRADGLDQAWVCLSSPIGVEALPRAEAQPILEAYHDGALELGHEFGAWGAIALDELDADDVDDVIARGCVGVSIPAGALADPHHAEDIAPALRRAQELDAPLLVHPGPAPWTPAAQAALTEPFWWPALAGYPAQMSAAWLTFVTVLRRELPRLRVVFAMLAGGAPLLGERLEARSARRCALRDPLTFYDVSSFGPQAIHAVGGLVGREQLVYGSDRPVLQPHLSAAQLELAGNAQRVLQPREVPA